MFLLTKYRNKQKISIQQIVQLWKKLQHYLKIIIYGQICFFFWWQVTLRQVTMNFRYTDFGPYLAWKRLLYWHWTLRTTKLTLYKRWFRYTYSMDSAAVSSMFTGVGIGRGGVSPLHFFCIFKHNNNHLISSFFSYACQDSD